MPKYLNKELVTILTTVGGGFFTVEAPDDLGINDDHFEVAGALDTLLAELGDLHVNISDRPSGDQVAQINQAYGKFLDALPSRDSKELQSLKMQLGKAKAEIKRLKEGNDGD